MAKTILNPFQQKTVQIIKTSVLSKKFYLSGGTALSEFYLHHRISEDLDFFTQEELDLEQLKRFINLVAKKTGAIKVEFQHGFGLYSFFLSDGKQRQKIDFGQYPFGPIEELRQFGDLLVESLYDIAVNKTHTIAFRPRLRDFIDLYFILQQEKNWNFQDLLQKSFEKFEMKVDSLQLGENLLQVKKLEDLPKMIKKVNLSKVQDFFLQELGKLETKIWKR